MKTTRLFLLVMALLALGLVPALSATAQDSLIESVCLVTDLGKVNDGTFNQFAHEGAVRATDDFGLDYNYIETQAQTDYVRNIQTCLDDGYDAIVTVGFLIAEATATAAQENPDVYFIGVDQGSDGTPNYVGLQFREDQAGFLAGALAAQMTESGTIAGVYGIDIPPVVKFRNGFEQGAKFVNPDIELLGVYIDSFTSPDRGAAAAAQFIGEGADVVFGAGGPTGSGGIVEAANQGVMVIGVDQDEYLTTFGAGESPGADMIISSAIKRVDNAVYTAIEALVNGGEDWPAGSNIVMSAANDGVGYAPAHDSTWNEGVEETMSQILEALKSGQIVTGVDPVSGEMLPGTLEAIEAAGNLTTLASALEAVGATEMPAGAALTIFAPTDDAFAALGELNTEDTEALGNVLLYHIIPGAALSADLEDGMTLTTAQGGEITVSVREDGVYLNDTVKVETADVLTREGVIHIIDTVLTPPAE